MDCSSATDGHFGPQVSTCLRAFDFTLLFEETVLSIGPAVLLLLLGPIRIHYLSSKPRRFHASAARWIKTIALAVLVILQLTFLVLCSLKRHEGTKATIASAALSLLVAIVMLGLSREEHTKSWRPSPLLCTFLFFTVLFDAARTRTLWLMDYDKPIAGLFSACLALKMVILLLESPNKSLYLDSAVVRSPEETSGIFSQSLFLWLNNLIANGYRKVLTSKDLLVLDSRLTSEALDAKFRPIWAVAPKSGNNALLLAVFKALKWPLLAPIFPKLVVVALTLTQPILIQSVTDFVQQPKRDNRNNISYGLIAAYAFTYTGVAVANAWQQHRLLRFITMIRGILVTVIYEKTVDMPLSMGSNADAVTLMSTDVERVVTGLKMMNEIWASLLQIPIASWLLYRQLGVAFVSPIALSLLCVFAVVALSATAGSRQKAWMKAIEDRIAFTAKTLGSMKEVKISGLTQKLSDVIQALRSDEINAANKFRVMLVYIVSLAYLPRTMSSVIAFGAFAGVAKAHHITLDSSRMFTSLAIISLITDPLSSLFQSLPEVFAAIACVGRVQKYLLTPNRVDPRSFLQSEKRKISNSVSSKARQDISVEEISLTTLESTERGQDSTPSGAVITVNDASFSWDAEATPVVYNVNFSLSSASLTMIIGPVASGKSTLLKGLLGETIVTGGDVQLPKSSIAFCDQTVWLTNASLRQNILGFSLFDSDWYAEVLHACALDVDLAQLPDGDHTILGSKGVTLSGGQKHRVAIARAVYAKQKIAIFDDVFSGLDAETEKLVFSRVFGAQGLLRRGDTCVILATHAVHLLPFADHIVALEEGKIAAQGSFEYLKADSRFTHLLSITKSDFNDDDIDDDVKDQQFYGKNLGDKPADDLPLDDSRRFGDKGVYRFYFGSIGIASSVIFLILEIIWTFLIKFPDIWLKWWSDANLKQPNQEFGRYIGIYTMFQALGLVALIILGRHLLFKMVVDSGSRLHMVLLRTIMRAPMELFSKTDTGTILNRFSQDITLVDAELPLALLNSVANGLICIAQAILVIPASYWIIISYPFLFGVIYAVQRYYLRTSRQLRFLDLEAKSPLYSQFLESLSGLATIRAFGWRNELLYRSSDLLDNSQRPFYQLFSIQQWLALVLNLITAGLATSVVALVLELRSISTAGFTGVALYNLMTLGDAMTSAVNTWTSMETSIGAISRIRKFERDTPSENKVSETHDPPEGWPTLGEVEIENLSVSYGPTKRAIDQFSLKVKAGEKIGICGRSGSGKSSLIMSIFRMIERDEGSIRVDGVDISTLKRSEVRLRFNAVPQESLFFKGTVRANLAPLVQASEEEMIAALQKTNLWSTIESKGGLDGEFESLNLSKGQEQLFSLSRAILRKSRLVVLDEATGSVDVETDKMMQEIIRAEFAGCTILVVAHRLNTILDFDRVVLLDQGRMVECDNPMALLAKPSSAFKDLYEAYKSKQEEEGDADAENEKEDENEKEKGDN